MKNIECDFCKTELNKSCGVTRYRLNLSCETLLDYGGISFDVYVLPPLEGDFHFCGLGCLREWLKKNE